MGIRIITLVITLAKYYVSWSSLEAFKTFEFLKEILLINGHCYKNDKGLYPEEHIEAIV